MTEVPKPSKEQAFRLLHERVEYKDSTFIAKLDEQRRRGIEHPFILCSDIDRSYIQRDGDVDLKRYFNATWEVTRILDTYSIPLILVTGNDLPIVRNYVASGWIPFPDIAGVSVGSEQYVLQTGAYGNYLEDSKYHRKSEQTFNRKALYPLCEEFLAELLSVPELRGIDLQFQPRDLPKNVEQWGAYRESSMNPQFKPDWEQDPQPFKISWKSFDLRKNPSQAKLVKNRLKEFEKKLHAMGHTGVSTLYVPGHDYDDIDLTIAKDVPINWLSEQTGICTYAFVGDSLNDLLAILKAGNLGFVTGGARVSLRSEIKALDTYQINNAIIGPRRLQEGLHKYIVDGKPRAIYIDDQDRKGPEGILWFLDQVKPLYLPRSVR